MEQLQSRHSTRIRLSNEELKAISEDINRLYTPKFSSNMPVNNTNLKMSANELLAISEEISREYKVRPPKYLPETVCVLMPVDPGHLHAYWHLDKKQQELIDKSRDKKLILRIINRSEKSIQSFQDDTYFDVACDHSTNQQTIALPPAFSGTKYSATLGQCVSGHKFIPYASSSITFLPRLKIDAIQFRTQAAANIFSAQIFNQNRSGTG